MADPWIVITRTSGYFTMLSMQRDQIRMLTNGTSGLPGRIMPEVDRQLKAMRGQPDLQASYYAALAFIQGIDPEAAERFVNIMGHQIDTRGKILDQLR